jgi:hypothetical protein
MPQASMTIATKKPAICNFQFGRIFEKETGGTI